ncbi:olfactory receptor 14I1-like [Tachyglossus aculeatus]|uniref:olfactory receptor 14I1-like n=1 Tax=Tachyglossus aculeatus TaxID=9261 RepID=UPI0018F45A48|nr:olfactory receptor 14I1-like [Tachyglossus aculeatus]
MLKMLVAEGWAKAFSTCMSHLGVINLFVMTEVPELQLFHAALFLLIYLTALVENLPIVAITVLYQSLPAPMYVFLTNLSVLDLCFISVTLSRSIIALTNHRSMSHQGFITQVCLAVVSATLELIVLTAMSYNHSVAIYRPLCYKAHDQLRQCPVHLMPKGILHNIPNVSTMTKFILQGFSEVRELQHLCVLDLCLISVTVPKYITISMTNNSSISFLGCMAQLLLVILFATLEYFALMVMSYNSYAAISCPCTTTSSWTRGL